MFHIDFAIVTSDGIESKLAEYEPVIDIVPLYYAQSEPTTISVRTDDSNVATMVTGILLVARVPFTVEVHDA